MYDFVTDPCGRYDVTRKLRLAYPPEHLVETAGDAGYDHVETFHRGEIFYNSPSRRRITVFSVCELNTDNDDDASLITLREVRQLSLAGIDDYDPDEYIVYYTPSTVHCTR